MTITRIAIEDLILDPAYQMRVGLDEDTVRDYADLLREGVSLGVCGAYELPTGITLTDGFHRVEAHKRVGLTTIKCHVEKGSTPRDALLDAITSNTDHGKRRTRADIRRAVTTLLKDAEWRAWSNGQIARRVGCSGETVRLIRKGLEGEGEIEATTCRTYTDASGHVRTMDTSGITEAAAGPEDTIPADPFSLAEEDARVDTSRAHQKEREALAVPERGTVGDGDTGVGDGEAEARRHLPQHLSESNEWYTPVDIIEAARRCMGAIDLDPASCEEANGVVQATHFYPREADGLGQPWGGRVWLNPPYGTTGGRSNAGLWAEEAIYRYNNGDLEEAILLVNASTGAKWFQALWHFPVCFVEGRLRFTAPGGAQAASPTHYNALVFLAHEERWEAFGEAYLEIGHIVWPQSATKRGEVG